MFKPIREPKWSKTDLLILAARAAQYEYAKRVSGWIVAA